MPSLKGQPGRIGCLRPACGRSWPDDGKGSEIVCGKCWKRLVPPRLRNRHKRILALLRRENRRRVPDSIRSLRLEGLFKRNWLAIRYHVLSPSRLGRPEGLSAFLEENRL